MRIALYQPDIPQNVAAIARLCACFDVPLDIIEPLGFIWDDKKLRRVGMDYLDHVDMTRHTSWEAFVAAHPTARKVLMTTTGARPLPEFQFQTDDILLMGRESAGVPHDVHAAAEARVIIPMRSGTRSLNVAQSAAIAIAEGLRQTHGFPAVSI